MRSALSLTLVAALVACAGAVTVVNVFPHRGSTNGGTYLVIEGSGFMQPADVNPWDAQAVFVGAIPCDIQRLPVTVQFFGGLGEAASSTLSDAFYYEASSTPALWWGKAWAGSGGDVLSFSGPLVYVASADQIEIRIGESVRSTRIAITFTESDLELTVQSDLELTEFN
ncbi:hypothetical protein T492DRAFT_834465 [Pavlovales sp. CCMP2436]|nr:hypothetical protein T492DRAFT_834465 [Pavlovales sp. CCMP2436]